MSDKITKEELTELINSIGEHEIRIDIDDKNSFETFLERIHLLQRALGLSILTCWVYKHTLAGYVQLRQNVPLQYWNVLFKEKFYLNRLGEPYQASQETFNEDLTRKLYIYLTCQIETGKLRSIT